MSKDPAFLFYTSDFISGTMFFTNEELGIYLRLLMAQHQHGHLTEKQVKIICPSLNQDILDKFDKDDDGLYFNKRLETEINKRKSFTESRRNNRKQLNNDSLHIYFIKNPDTGLVKIGSSVDVERRFIELKRQYKSDLKLLFVSVKYPQTKESELHKIFADKKEINEWYKLSKSDLEDIKTKHIEVHMNNHMNVHMENKDKDINKDNNKVESEIAKTPLEVKFFEFVKFRKAKRQPILEESMQAFKNKLWKLSKQNEQTAIEILEQSIANGWTGIFELKEQNHNGNEKGLNSHVLDSLKERTRNYIIKRTGKDPMQ